MKDLEAAWVALERALVAASLGEISPSDARDRMCATVSEHLAGARCTLVEGHLDAEDAGERILLGSSFDDNASTLTIGRGASLDPKARARLVRLFELLLQVAHPVRRGARTFHELRNRLAGLQSNVELVELAIGDADLGPDFPRDDVLTSLAHVSAVCRDMNERLRALSGLESR
ncbi:MAG: hypothetical protein KF850_30195 [Labilithrix sp.]|nr:hypothetical protein [Labilithrix sp.]